MMSLFMFCTLIIFPKIFTSLHFFEFLDSHSSFNFMMDSFSLNFFNQEAINYFNFISYLSVKHYYLCFLTFLINLIIYPFKVKNLAIQFGS
jgi:hypothetical protein